MTGQKQNIAKALKYLSEKSVVYQNLTNNELEELENIKTGIIYVI